MIAIFTPVDGLVAFRVDDRRPMQVRIEGALNRQLLQINALKAKHSKN